MILTIPTLTETTTACSMAMRKAPCAGPKPIVMTMGCLMVSTLMTRTLTLTTTTFSTEMSKVVV